MITFPYSVGIANGVAWAHFDELAIPDIDDDLKQIGQIHLCHTESL